MELVSVRLPLRVLADAGGWQLSKWLVQAGAPVYRKQPVAVLKSLTTGAIDHALAPHSGTLVNTLIKDGDSVDTSKAPIAEVEFCPHSVVFKGVCAVCGEEAEQAHFAETSSLEESRLPVAYNATSLSVTRAEAESVASRTAHRLLEEKRLSLVLDLDHTLVHATDDVRASAILHHSPDHVDKSSVSSFTLKSSTNSRSSALMHVKLRPHLSQFLSRLATKFELHIYTMGSRPYADQIAHLIDPDKRLFSGRITSREDFAEGRCNQKSIQRLFPCDDSMVLIVDDREDVWISGTGQAYMPNLIRAAPYSFWDGLHEAYDRALTTNELEAPPPTYATRQSPQIQLPFPPTTQSNSKHAQKLGHSPETSNSNGHDTHTNGTSNGDERIHAQHDKMPDANIPKREHSLSADGQLDPAEKGAGSKTNASKEDPQDAKSVEDSLAFSSELRRIVNGWWIADAQPKSSAHLLRLAQILEDCHSEFFRQSKLLTAKGKVTRPSGRGFQAPANVKDILSNMRSCVLKGCILTFTGIIPTGTNPETVPAWNLALRLGADCSMEYVNGRTTHVVASQHRAATTQKCKDALRAGSSFVVTQDWLENSSLHFEREEEFSYCIGIDPTKIEKSKFNEAVRQRYERAAEALRKRNYEEAKIVSDDGTEAQSKRPKLDGPYSQNDVSPSKSADIQILSGDEIGAAIDDAFED